MDYSKSIVEHWLEQKIAQWGYQVELIQQPNVLSWPRADALPQN